MRPKDRELGRCLDAELQAFATHTRPLPGIRDLASREAFIEQLVESIRRVRYISAISTSQVSAIRTNPSSPLFDPLKAAVQYRRMGQIDEAFWLVFLSVHFGKHLKTGWRLARDVYGSLGEPLSWSWARTSSDPPSFSRWLAEHEVTFHSDGIPRHFGNHRKYETLKASSPRGTGRVVESYVSWVNPPRTHQMLVNDALNEDGGNGRLAFDRLYHSMNSVVSFGRTARFDYLTMLGKLGLAEIEPGSTHMQGATGPLKGARLLFGGSTSATLNISDLDTWLVELEATLSIGIQGMQVLEDVLCNWQKSPRRFVPFRG